MRDLSSSSDLNALKIPELKEELEARGVLDKKLRLKKDLVDALQKVLEEAEGKRGASALSPPKEMAEKAADEKTGQREEAEQAGEDEEIDKDTAVEKGSESADEDTQKADAAVAEDEEERRAREEEERQKEEERLAREAVQRSLEEAKRRKAQEEAERKAAEERAAKPQAMEQDEPERRDSSDEKRLRHEASRRKEEAELRQRLLEGQTRKGGDSLKRAPSNHDSEPGTERKRRRGWGSSASTNSATPAAAINTDMLKDLITEVVSVDESVDDERAPTPPEAERNVEEPTKASDEVTAEVTVEKSVEEEDDAAATASLHIRNFTRPLQLREVMALLGESGKLIEGENGFWMDKQKRRCCCTYETVEMAKAGKRAIHGLRFPLGNPKKLEVEYVKLEDLPALRVDEAATVDRRRTDRAAQAEKTLSRGDTVNGNEKDPDSRRESKAESVAEPEEGLLQLEKLFNKTKSEPHIFWKPLTDEEAQEKLKRKAESRTRR